MAALYPPPPTSCPTGQHASNGVCVLDTLPPPTTCNTGYHLSNGACVPDTITPPPAGDVYAPIILVANPPLASLTMAPGPITIAGSAVDYTGGTGLYQVRVRVNVDAWVLAIPSIAGDWTRWSLPITFNTPGFYAVHIEATDRANPANATYLTIPITVSAGAAAAPLPPANIPLPTMPASPPATTPPPASGDTIAPTVRIDSPIINASVPVGNVTVSGVASDNMGLSAVDVRLDNGPWLPATGTTNWTVIIPITVSGTHVLQARATDSSGNMQWFDTAIVATGTAPPTSCQTGYHLSNGVCVADTVTPPPTGDTTPPNVAITSPLTGSSSAGSIIHLTGTASDIVGIAGVFVRIVNFPVGSGSPWLPATVTGGTWSIDYDAFGSGNFVGPYVFEARADDAAGNMQWSNQVTVNYTPGTGGGGTTCPTGQKIGGTSGACESIVTTYNSGGSTIKDIFAPGETLRVTGTGFAVGESVEFRLRINQSTAQVLNGTANGSGSATMAMTIPAGQAPTTDAYVMCTGANGLVGRHTISITATGAYGRAMYGRGGRIVRMARTRVGQSYNRNPYEEMAISYR